MSRGSVHVDAFIVAVCVCLAPRGSYRQCTMFPCSSYVSSTTSIRPMRIACTIFHSRVAPFHAQPRATPSATATVAKGELKR